MLAFQGLNGKGSFTQMSIFSSNETFMKRLFMSKDDMCAPLGILTFFTASAKAKLSLMVNVLNLSETGLSNVDNQLAVACWGEFTMEILVAVVRSICALSGRHTSSGMLLQPVLLSHRWHHQVLSSCVVTGVGSALTFPP